MPILFSAVARDNVVLAKFASCEGNFSEIAGQVLSKLPTRNDKVTYFHGHYLIHYIFEDRRLYFCITDKGCQRSKAFLFLNQLKRRLVSEGKARLTEVLADEMHRYSEDFSTVVIREGELDELNTIGVRSSEEILGEKLLLVNNAEKLNFSVISYVGKPRGEVLIHNNSERTLDDPHIFANNHGIRDTVDLSVSAYKTEMCIDSIEHLGMNEKYKPSAKIFIALFIIALLIYFFDIMPFGHVVVLLMFIIFVLFK